MKQKSKKLLSLLLALTMIMSMLSVSAFAAEDADETGILLSADNLQTDSEYSSIYYAGVPWRVLSTEYSSNSNDDSAKEGVLLLSEYLFARGTQWNAHYGHDGQYNTAGSLYARPDVLPKEDSRNDTKTDQSDGGYISSDIRTYLTGEGEYEGFRPQGYYDYYSASLSKPADTNVTRPRYWIREAVTETEPVPGVVYYVKGEFELSDHTHDTDGGTGGTLTMTAADWAEDTWYTYDEAEETATPVTQETFAVGESYYYDQSAYVRIGELTAFDEEETYYTFTMVIEDVNDDLPTITGADGESYTMGENLASVYYFSGFSVTALEESSNPAESREAVAGLSGSDKNFAEDLGISEIEQKAVLPTSGHGYKEGESGATSFGNQIGTAYSDALMEDTYFLLSGAEVKTYLTSAGHTASATYLDGTTTSDSWTRSFGRSDIVTIITYQNNAVNWYKGGNTWWQGIRPAFNLNPDSVLYFAPVDDAENTYKMALLDEDRNFEIDCHVAEGNVTVYYTGAKTGENEYISLLVVDADGEVLQYAQIAEVLSASGEVTFTLPESGTAYVFNEQINSETETNYASEMKEIKYAVSFDANGGDGNMEEQSVVIGESLTLPENSFTWTGYTFNGWNTLSDGSGKAYEDGANVKPTGTLILYAQWEANTYTISFNGGSGSGTMADVQATYDTYCTLPAAAFTLEGKYFDGWATESNGDVIYAEGAQVLNLTAEANGQVTLYAVYAALPSPNPELTQKTVIYNGDAQSFALEGYTIAYQQDGKAVDNPTDAGAYDVIISRAATEEYAAYNNFFAEGLIIEKASLTITPKDITIYVGGSVPTDFGYRISGLCGGDQLTTEPTFTIVEGTVDTGKAGTYTIEANGADAGDNYDISYMTGVLSVSERSSGGGVSTYAITIADSANGKVTASKQTTSSGTTVTLTVTPDTGYALETLIVTKSDGTEVELTGKDGKYTFKMPASKITVTATFMEDNTMLNYFMDVFATDYYYEAVMWAVEVGITNGTSDTAFSPDATCTRAQMATFLWRAAGCPEPVSGVSPFDDVPADAYYAKAVQWAVEKGITYGTSATTFSPNADCTRAQMAAFLWRNANAPVVGNGANPFTDVPADAYYTAAVQWAYEQEITRGTTDTTFSPDAICTRGQMVTFLYRNFVD